MSGRMLKATKSPAQVNRSRKRPEPTTEYKRLDESEPAERKITVEGDRVSVWMGTKKRALCVPNIYARQITITLPTPLNGALPAPSSREPIEQLQQLLPGQKHLMRFTDKGIQIDQLHWTTHALSDNHASDHHRSFPTKRSKKRCSGCSADALTSCRTTSTWRW